MYNLYPRTLRHLQEGHAIFHVNSADSKSVSVCDRSPTIGQVAYETAKRPNVRTRLRIVWLAPPFLHSGNYMGQGEPLIVLHVWQGSVVSHSFANVQEQREEGSASLLTSGAVEAPIVVQAKLYYVNINQCINAALIACAELYVVQTAHISASICCVQLLQHCACLRHKTNMMVAHMCASISILMVQNRFSQQITWGPPDQLR